MAREEHNASRKTPGGGRFSGEYWRIAEQREAEGCVFCDLKEKYIVAEEENGVLTANLYPYINGQLLVMPKRHIEDSFELTDDEVLDAHSLMKSGKRLLAEELETSNFWWILRDGEEAGKTVRHLHWNLMPYEEGLNTWHYQKITLSPQVLAERLRQKI